MAADRNIRDEPFPGDGKNARFRRATHDLSNLLGVILGNVDLAISDLASGHPAADSLREIQQAARDARTICRQMRESLHEPVAKSPPRPVTWVAKRFLLIDDDEAFCSLFERSLLGLGHEVRSFSSPVEALEVFSLNPGGYDIVISDLNLPGANGMEVAVIFLQRSPHLCVCLTSGGLTGTVMEEAREAGVRHVISKPGTTEEMAAVILRLVADAI